MSFENIKNRAGMNLYGRSKKFFDIIGVQPPNSRRDFLNFGKIQHINQFAVKQPTFNFDDKAIQKEFEQFLKDNSFIELLQFLEAETYIKGQKALGVIKEGEELIVRIADVHQYRIKGNKLVYLIVAEGNLKNKDIKEFLYKEYDIKSKSTFIKEFKSDDKAVQRIKTKSNETNHLTFIPWLVFKNNYEGSTDIESVSPFTFSSLDRSWEILLRDAYTTSPFAFINETVNDHLTEKVDDSFYKLDNRIIRQSTISSFSAITDPVKFISNPSQSDTIRRNIDKYQLEIKKAMFLPNETSDLGTKNLQTTEVQNLNSSYENFIEGKANLRELFFYQFVQIWYKLFKNNSNEKIDVEIVVQGSTSWLEKEALKVSANQQGMINKPVIEYSKKEEDE